MVPDGRLRTPLLRPPGEDRLRLAADEAPVHGPDVLRLEEREDVLEPAPVAPGHVFGADERTPEALEPGDPLLRPGFVHVGVERNDVGILGLEAVELRELLRVVPDARGQRLRGRRRPRPFEDLLEQGQRLRPARLVVEVPGEDAPVAPGRPRRRPSCSSRGCPSAPARRPSSTRDSGPSPSYGRPAAARAAGRASNSSFQQSSKRTNIVPM